MGESEEEFDVDKEIEAILQNACFSDRFDAGVTSEELNNLTSKLPFGKDVCPNNINVNHSNGSSATSATTDCDDPAYHPGPLSNSLSAVAFASLFEIICKIFEPDPQKRKQLFMYIAETFIRLKLIPALSFSDKLLPARQRFQAAVAKLLENASIFVNDLAVDYRASGQNESATCNNSSDHEKINEGKRKKLKSFTPKRSDKTITLLHSRYYNEFEEISCLGKGGFGSCFKVRSYIDEQCYAVKKISFDFSRSLVCVKLLREVRLLASLNHSNVVRYYGAWLEFAPTDFRTRSDILARNRAKTNQGCRVAEIKELSDESATNERSLSSLRGSFSSPSIVFEKNAASNRQDDRRISLLNRRTKSQSCSNVSEERGLTFDVQNSSSDDENGKFDNDSKILNKTMRRDWPTARCLILYVQMELGSKTLRDWLNNRNAKVTQSAFLLVDTKRVESILKQLLSALAYIHDKGIIHRDIKPSNVFLKDGDDHVILGDFGLACFVNSENYSLSYKDEHSESECEHESGFDVNNGSIVSRVAKQPRRSRDRSFRSTGLGTFTYSAPEQLKSHYYNDKADMYSIGVIAYELYYPFRTNMERMQCLMELKSGKINASFKQMWPAQALFIESLVQNDPALRPSARELLKSEWFQNNDENKAILSLKAALEEYLNENRRLKEENEKLKSAVYLKDFAKK